MAELTSFTEITDSVISDDASAWQDFRKIMSVVREIRDNGGLTHQKKSEKLHVEKYDESDILDLLDDLAERAIAFLDERREPTDFNDGVKSLLDLFNNFTRSFEITPQAQAGAFIAFFIAKLQPPAEFSRNIKKLTLDLVHTVLSTHPKFSKELDIATNKEWDQLSEDEVSGIEFPNK